MKTRGILQQPARAGLGLLGSLALCANAHAAIDGTDDGGEGYVTISSQTVATNWGASNFLGNLKAVQVGNTLNLMLGGRADNNSFLLFIDSKPGGANVISSSQITSGGEEYRVNNLNGFTFETGMDADYAINVWPDNTSNAYTGVYDLQSGVRTYIGDATSGNISGNIISDGKTQWVNDDGDPELHEYGVELSLDLLAMGVPTGTNDLRLFAVLLNGGADYASSQILGPQSGTGDIGGGIIGFDLNTNPIATGTQTVTLSVTVTNPDNDGDGLSNDDETNVYFTDPNDADSDDDGLDDGDEVNLHSTDPNDPDSDDDNVNDATEIAAGTDPNLDTSEPPAGDTTIIGFDFFDYPDGSIDGQAGNEPDQFDYDNINSTSVINGLAQDPFVGHTTESAPWSTSFGTEVSCGELITVNDSSASRDLNGAFTGGNANGRVENIVGANATNIYVKVDMTRRKDASYSGIMFLNGGSEIGYAGVLGDGSELFGVEEPGVATTPSALPVPDEREVYTIVAKLDTAFNEVQIFVNPASFAGGSEPAFGDAFLTLGTPAAVTGIKLLSGGSGRTEWDNLVVATSWEALDDAVGTDSDTDSLRDSWEEVYSPGDLNLLTGAGDNEAPGDMVINTDEQAAGTNPLDGDSDGDSLTDFEEINGTANPWLMGSKTGPVGDPTDPCFGDSDDDTIDDGEEVNFGTDNHETDPNNADTDGDGEDDNVEVFQGTDPEDAGSSSAALGLVIVDGTVDGVYGPATTVQTVQTQFGDNNSELNAAYAHVKDGKLYLTFTGNLENNFNKLEIFFDTVGGGQNVIDDSVNNSGSNPDIDGDAYSRLAGLTFDSGFAADYHIYVRRGSGKFDLDFVELGGSGTFYEDVFSGTEEGFANTGTGVNAMPIGVGFDNSNDAGVAGGTAAADQVAAAAVTTGIELCIDLDDLGSPSGEIKIAAMINSSNHDYLSNQVLGGLPAPQGNLGSDGAGNGNGNVAGVDFNSFGGDQFFTVTTPLGIEVESVALISGGTEIEIVVKNLTIGADYVVKESTTLAGFTEIPSEAFTASAVTETITIPVDTMVVPTNFYIVEDAP